MQKRTVGRPRGGDPVATRRGILSAAEECFAASGFVGATTRQVASRAGVNVATLHYHFGSKEELYRAVLDAATRKGTPVPGSGSTPEERLSSTVEALWDSGAAHPLLPRLSLLHRLAGPPSLAEALEMHEDSRAALLAQTLAESGRKTPLAPAEAARVILALLDGALVAAQSGRTREEPPSATFGTLRAGVVAAALRVAGFA